MAQQGKIAQARSTYKEAQQLDPNLEISADSWNTLCWNGSLYGSAAEVMDACEKAVAKEPKNAVYRDSRGLARALTGDTAGAISDFQFFLDSPSANNYGDYNVRLQKWIDDLRAGQNPFTEEVLESLK